MEYREWLVERQLELQECIREGENAGWHHSPVGTVEETMITNLIGLEVKVRAQIQKFPIRTRLLSTTPKEG